MKNMTRLLLSIVLVTTLMINTLWAGEHGKISEITGSLTIKPDVSQIKNILTNSQNSKGRVNIGHVRSSIISGNVNLNEIKVGEVINELVNANSSSARVNIGSIHNSTVKDADVRIKVKKVENKVNGGSKNHGIVNIGAIGNSTITGNVKINIGSSGTVTNALSKGSGSRSEVGVGSVVSEDELENINPWGETQQYTDYSKLSVDIAEYFKDYITSIQESSGQSQIVSESELEKSKNTESKLSPKPPTKNASKQ